MLANGTFIIYRRLKKVELRKKTMKKKKKQNEIKHFYSSKLNE